MDREKGKTWLTSELSKRYAPFVDWQSIVDIDALIQEPKERYWRTPQEIAMHRTEKDLPLKGLRLVLDPGHVGGQWAAHEQREFRIEETDFYVREAELALEVAKRARTQLIELGAEVTLLREALVPVNSKRPIDYLEEAMEQLPFPDEHSPQMRKDYAVALRSKAIRLALVSGELTERARLVNEVIQPDALISVHMNATSWPGAADDGTVSELQLVNFNDLHVLIFGCMSEEELKLPHQQAHLAAKLNNGSGTVEQLLGSSMAAALADATKLPPAKYEKLNAVLLDPEEPYVFARNLLILRMAECPTVLLEPYIVNSEAVYLRLQSALADWAAGSAPAKDDILVEYANAVVSGVLKCYANVE